MGYVQLSSRDCSHCFNRRRDAREKLERRGATAEYIEEYLKTVLCPEHEALSKQHSR